ncbi:flagellar basal body-associated FliL family protein [Stakelama sp. CBK3Z-3]|uniref:Flagellar protein FliL n=1 Tax=Stakelama flava TaxID=2860338 RepID=A0ABS6XKJ8_9SPHN|nr:flagellar basal body-associated FliL family protein [Stakelama flava]MBW4330454.1 flagellar basal body-associated FliL family protein [Stakelama flava]
MSEDKADISADAAEETAAPKKGKKKLFIIAAGALALVGGVGGGAYAFLGGDPAEASDSGHGAEAGDHGGGEGTETFVDVPAMMVNLRSTDGSAHFLKVHFMLVPGPAGNADAIEAKLPLLLDSYQPFLRELRPEDLNGSAAVFRVKEELLLRADDVLGHGQVKDILIQDMIQQ